jgi:hypothetical protein
MIRSLDYCLKYPTLAIEDVRGHHNVVASPAGTAVTKAAKSGASTDGGQLVAIEWEGKTVSIFAADLKRRGR